MGVGGGVSEDVAVSAGMTVDVGRIDLVGSLVGRDVFVTAMVAVTTRTTGDGQLHWFSGSGVFEGVDVTVRV